MTSPLKILKIFSSFRHYVSSFHYFQWETTTDITKTEQAHFLAVLFYHILLFLSKHKNLSISKQCSEKYEKKRMQRSDS